MNFWNILKSKYTSLYKAVLADWERLCPKPHLVFKALEETPLDKVKVVILGQDPYHTPGKAAGICFGYHPLYDGPINSSLQNIIAEIKSDCGIEEVDPTLKHLPPQGVLMLNTRLTTRKNEVLAHKDIGWDNFLKAEVFDKLNEKDHIIWMLWGKEAQKYKKWIKNKTHHILKASHPCKYSAKKGFLGCKHFSECNKILKKLKKKPIDWGRLPNKRKKQNFPALKSNTYKKV